MKAEMTEEQKKLVRVGEVFIEACTKEKLTQMQVLFITQGLLKSAQKLIADEVKEILEM